MKSVTEEKANLYWFLQMKNRHHHDEEELIMLFYNKRKSEKNVKKIFVYFILNETFSVTLSVIDRKSCKYLQLTAL